MAISTYDAYFDRLRACIAALQQLEEFQEGTATLPQDLLYIKNAFMAVFEGDAATDESAHLYSQFTSVDSTITNLKEQIAVAAANVLHKFGVALKVPGNASTDQIIDALIIAMDEDGEDVRTRTLIVAVLDTDADDAGQGGTIKAWGSNLGNGKLVYTFTQADSVMGTNEISFAEVMSCECINAPSFGNGVFQLVGQTVLSRAQSNVATPRGSGVGSSLTCAYGGGLVTDGDFEIWTSSPAEASNWTIQAAKTWGTDIAQESTEQYNEDYCLEFPASKSCYVEQTVSLQASTTYCIGAWIKKGASATGDIHFKITNAETARTQQHLTITKDVATALTTSWVFYYDVFTTTNEVESDWLLQIAGASIATENVYVDLVQLVPMIQHNGINFAAFVGSDRFRVGDKFGYGNGTDLGFIVELDSITNSIRQADSPYADDSADNQTKFSFTDLDYTSDFLVGNWVQHPTDLSWHMVTSSTKPDADTYITVTPASATSWDNALLRAKTDGRLQNFFGRYFGRQLPSAASGEGQSDF